MKNPDPSVFVEKDVLFFQFLQFASFAHSKWRSEMCACCERCRLRANAYALDKRHGRIENFNINFSCSNARREGYES